MKFAFLILGRFDAARDRAQIRGSSASPGADVSNFAARSAPRARKE